MKTSFKPIGVAIIALFAVLGFALGNYIDRPYIEVCITPYANGDKIVARFIDVECPDINNKGEKVRKFKLYEI